MAFRFQFSSMSTPTSTPNMGLLDCASAQGLMPKVNHILLDFFILHFTCLLLYCTSGLHSQKLPHVTLTVTQKNEGKSMTVINAQIFI